MHTLVFDTSAGGVIIGLYDNERQLQKVERIMEFGQAEVLATEVDSVLKTNHLTFKDIDLLGVCVGPGSFTGVRAGLSFARGLSFGLPHLNITGVSAFEAYVRMLKEKDRAFYNAVVIETKRDDFYFQLFDENLRKVTQPLAVSREEIVHLLKNRQTSFIGDGVERFLSVSLGLQIKQVEISDIISTEALFKSAYEKYLEKTLDFPKPLYIRSADACVKS